MINASPAYPVAVLAAIENKLKTLFVIILNIGTLRKNL